MEREVGRRTGVAYGEKTTKRLARRNGYRDRDRQTRAWTVELRIPKRRTGSCFPSFLEPRRAVEKALTAFANISRTDGVPMAHSRRPASTASRRAPWTISCRPWAAPASRRAGSAGSARRSMIGSTRS